RPLRDERFRFSHLILLDQDDPWRSALSRALRVPAGARGADGARGAAGQGAASQRASPLRAAARTASAAALDAAAWLVPLRSSRLAHGSAEVAISRVREVAV